MYFDITILPNIFSKKDLYDTYCKLRNNKAYKYNYNNACLSFNNNY